MIIKNNRIKCRHTGKTTTDYNPLENLEIKGSVRLLGVTLTNSTPVVLIDSASLNIIQKTMTDKNGEYKFEWLTSRPHIVVATRVTKDYNAVIQDNVVPK